MLLVTDAFFSYLTFSIAESEIKSISFQFKC